MGKSIISMAILWSSHWKHQGCPVAPSILHGFTTTLRQRGRIRQQCQQGMDALHGGEAKKGWKMVKSSDKNQNTVMIICVLKKRQYSWITKVRVHFLIIKTLRSNTCEITDVWKKTQTPNLFFRETLQEPPYFMDFHGNIPWFPCFITLKQFVETLPADPNLQVEALGSCWKDALADLIGPALGKWDSSHWFLYNSHISYIYIYITIYI